uniref:Putative tick transposon n=1 Tax=Rhipicephalus pulchellus TaxID=72859 RepID=L7LUT5_RHIPC
MASHIFLFIPQLFGALALGQDCDGVPRHGGMLRNASATAEASFLDDYALPASSWPGDYCLPRTGISPVDQCFIDGGAVDQPCDQAVMADGFPATMFSCTAALLWRGGRVTDRRSPDIHCASTTSSSAPMANQLNVGASNAVFSGHGRTTGIMASHIFLFIPQVSCVSISRLKSDDPFIIVLPCPEAVLAPFCSLLLLLCGDVESNPGPPKEQPSDALTEVLRTLRDLNQITKRMEDNQKEMLGTITELKTHQETVVGAISEIKARLATVETQTGSLEKWQHELGDVVEAVGGITKEAAVLRSRLDDAEDRSRRNNLLFYGVTDIATESAVQSEQKIIDILNNTLTLSVPSDNISRAHRIGRFFQGKSRPIIVNFTAYKTKEEILSKRAGLKESNISVSEDFCPATRHARKALIEYGRNLNLPYKLRYKKLLIDGKCYGYDTNEQKVYEIKPSSTANDTAASVRVLRPRRNMSTAPI